MNERTTLTVTSTSADTGEVWVSSEKPVTVEVRKYAKLGHLIGPRLVATYLPGLRQVSFGVVSDFDTVRIRISVKMARRLARFILDNTEDKKHVPDGAKEEQTKANKEEA